jgi:hypothetical protein
VSLSAGLATRAGLCRGRNSAEGIVFEREHFGHFEQHAGLLVEDLGAGEHRKVRAEVETAFVADGGERFAGLFLGGAGRHEKAVRRCERGDDRRLGRQPQRVLAVDGDGGRFVEVQRVLAALPMEHGEIELNALGGQQTERVVELEQSGAVDAVDGDGLVRLIFEDFADGIGHVPARAEFDEDAEPVLEHAADGIVEPDGGGPLIGREIEDVARLGGKAFGRGAGVDGDVRHVADPVGEKLLDGGERFGTPGGVEGTVHGHDHGFGAGFVERFRDPLENRGGEGDRLLARAVEEREHHAARVLGEEWPRRGRRARRAPTAWCRRQVVAFGEAVEHLVALPHERMRFGAAERAVDAAASSAVKSPPLKPTSPSGATPMRSNRRKSAPLAACTAISDWENAWAGNWSASLR